jgi:hypothetical protein
MTLDARRLWVVCKTFGVLPNDPRVADLTHLQMEWIIFNLAAEHAQVDDLVGGKGALEITNSRNGAFLGKLGKQGA